MKPRRKIPSDRFLVTQRLIDEVERCGGTDPEPGCGLGVRGSQLRQLPSVKRPFFSRVRHERAVPAAGVH